MAIAPSPPKTGTAASVPRLADTPRPASPPKIELPMLRAPPKSEPAPAINPLKSVALRLVNALINPPIAPPPAPNAPAKKFLKAMPKLPNAGMT